MNYSYTRKRRDFGRPCAFDDSAISLITDINPDRSLENGYLFKAYQHKAVQAAPTFSYAAVNSESVPTSDHGVFHHEGGWPKEVNRADEEAVLRFQKRMQRDDNYILIMQKLTKIMEHNILQNNTINIYEKYFANVLNDLIKIEDTRVVVKNTYHCADNSPILAVSWHSGTPCSFIVTIDSCQAFIWDLHNPNEWRQTIDADAPFTCAEFCPASTGMVAAGLKSGQVGYWNPLQSKFAKAVSPYQRGFQSAPNKLFFTVSKSNTNFFTSSSSGTVQWWDMKNLEQPTEEIDVGTLLSTLEFDISLPTRFSVGTADGFFIAGSRRGTTLLEKLPWRIKIYDGPIRLIQRNPLFTKNYLIVCDQQVCIWSENCRESPVMWTNQKKVNITGASWSPTRVSVMILALENGILEVWDLLQSRFNPSYSTKLSQYSLTCIRFHQKGELVAVGAADGTVYVVQLTNNLVKITSEEKAMFSEVIEREASREKLIEAKGKELRMKMKARQVHFESYTEEEVVEELKEDDDNIASDDDEFHGEVGEEKSGLVLHDAGKYFLDEVNSNLVLL